MTQAQANLPGSLFEGNDANMVVNTQGNLDWINAPNLEVGTDLASGQTDNSFGGGTQEKDLNVTVGLGSIPNSKADLGRFAVASETLANGDVMMYLAWTRNNTSGSTNFDFEINEAVQPDLTTPGPKALVRTVGDLLINYSVQGGAQVPTLNYRTWQADGTWSGVTPLAAPIAEAAINTGGAVVNTLGGPANIPASQFGEAAINMTAAGIIDNQNDPDASCVGFGSAYVKSRASQSFTSEIKDFIAPIPLHLNTCESITTTQPQDSDGDAITSVSIGTGSVTVHDHATIEGSGLGSSNPTGSVDFYLCGPTDDISSCDADTGVPVSTEILDGSSNPAEVDSDDVVITSAGDYCFFAEYSGDAVYPGSSDGAVNECFTVTPAQPTISTNAVTPVNPGQAISDTATLSGTATQPDGDPAGGSITFSAYGPDDADCEGTPAFVSDPIPVSGDGSTYNSGNFTETEVGTYHWIAVYTGDSPNTLSVSGSCGDANEDSVVNQEQPTLTTAQSWVPQDSATVVSPSSAAVKGTIHFDLFASADCGELGGDLAVYSEDVPIDGASGTVGTTSNDGDPSGTEGGYTASASGDFSWLVSYTSDLASQADISATCVETSSLTVDNGDS